MGLIEKYNLLSTIRNSFKHLFYNINIDIKSNDKNLSRVNLDKNYINKTLAKFGYNSLDFNLSYHYHLFAGLSKNSNKKKIIEIGTHVGNFTNFISKNFKFSKIYTCDLNSSNKLLTNKNIFFKKMNSFELLKIFKKNYFDIIWLDGNHFNPQVTMDVISAYYLLKKNGVLICDDIFLDKKYTTKNSTDGYKPISYLGKIKKVKTTYFVKRFSKINAYRKKYISYSIKI